MVIVLQQKIDLISSKGIRPMQKSKLINMFLRTVSLPNCGYLTTQLGEIKISNRNYVCDLKRNKYDVSLISIIIKMLRTIFFEKNNK